MAKTKLNAAMPMATSDYDAQYDADTLARAGEIMGDKRRHAAARQHMERKMAGMQRVMSAAKAPAPPRAPSLGLAKKR